MCTLLVHVPASPDGTLYLGANRDESYGRPSKAPGPIQGDTQLWGGLDLEAGGSWLCARGDPPGRIVAVLNRPQRPGADAHAPPLSGTARRSRGLLCLDAARAGTMDAAEVEASRQVETFRSAPFNLFLAESDAVRVIAYDGVSLRSCSLTPGWHALTHGEPDDTNDPRIAEALDAVKKKPPSVDLLRAVLSRNRGPGAACRHGPRYGTVSSTIVEAQLSERDFRWAYAAGPPCETAYGVSHFLPAG